MSDEPRFEHDCDKCLYLGCGTVLGREYDYWLHPGQPAVMTSLIARYGAEADYESWPRGVWVQAAGPVFRGAYRALTRWWFG